jgi:drug/metabolite transporter (DMT)-like permease
MSLVVSLLTISIIVAGLPLGAYLSFKGLSRYDVALAAAVIPLWLTFVSVACLREIMGTEPEGDR